MIAKLKWLLLVFVLGLLVYTLTLKAEITSFKKQVKKFKFEQTEFVMEINEQGFVISEQEQVIFSQKDAIDLQLLEIDRLKKVNSQVNVVTQTLIDSVFIPFNNDSVKNFTLTDKWYGLGGLVKSEGVMLDSIYFNNELSITIGYKKEGLFKKPSPIVEIKNKNPHSRTISMQNIVIENPTKWYEKKTFLIGVGLLVGIIIAK